MSLYNKRYSKPIMQFLSYICIHAISCEILQIFRGDLVKFWDFYENHFQAYISKLKAIILMN